MFWKIIGLTAAALTTFSFVPQIVKVIKKKSVKDVSLFMLVQFALGVSFWALYGIYLKDAIIIFANCLTLLTLIILLALYFKYLNGEA
jgi:MtN3 and saliva related transmembrane protein